MTLAFSYFVCVVIVGQAADVWLKPRLDALPQAAQSEADVLLGLAGGCGVLLLNKFLTILFGG